jgi:hypothetical protein
MLGRSSRRAETATTCAAPGFTNLLPPGRDPAVHHPGWVDLSPVRVKRRRAVSRPLTPAEAAEQGQVIYRAGWPHGWGLARMGAMVATLASCVLLLWLGRSPELDRFDTQSKLAITAFWWLVVVLVTLTDDIVEVTATAVRRRSHLSELLGRGFRAVDLEPGSWYVRSKYFKGRVLWVGAPPHTSPKQEVLTFNVRFDDDPKGLAAVLRQAGVGIEDEHAEWVARRPILSRLEMALYSAWFVSISVAYFGLVPDAIATALMTLIVAALLVVHVIAR